MARFDKAIGRYVYLSIEDVEYRVYFEEHGSGIPLLLQHTAGADSRQWRHLLEHDDVASHFRMIAYDLPYHGRSLPPLTRAWWTEEYELTTGFLTQVPVALSRELGLDPPVFMGCSIGGLLAVDLALHHPDAFRAVIGLEAALKTSGRAPDDAWYHPRIGNDYKAGRMRGLMSPTSPEPLKRETTWIYSQGAPPVMKGDLYYYHVDHDLTQGAEEIDTAKVAVFLLTGEYDYSCTPEMSAELARRIEGARFAVMPGLGHFPMSEDPDRFLGHLLPILAEIRTL
jgi:pimeloyl-ACP methyl ester carboxylesterase